MARQIKKGTKPRSPTVRASKSASASPSNAFVEAVKFVLEHLDKHEVLGKESPLAAPYFLGAWLGNTANTADTHTPASRGRVLSDLVRKSMELVDPRLHKLLHLYYLDERVQKRANRGLAVAEAMFSSKPAVMRDLRLGLSKVAQQLSQQVSPPLRAEHPQPRALVGRTALLKQADAALSHLRPVALTGVSGIGKTTLGLALATRWPGAVLWYTLRLNLNDRLLSLVFTLGYFLRNLGAGNTWQQLVADNGEIKNEEAIFGLLRKDLSELAAAPLICVDELDLLNAEWPEHKRIQGFLESLRGQVPLVFMSQRPLIEVLNLHDHLALTGLTAAELEELLVSEGLHWLSPAEKARLLEATLGNPALLRMFIILHHAGEGVPDTLRRIGSNATAEVMLQRIWSRLAQDERTLLMALAVFQDMAPRDGWTSEADQATITSLVQRGLVDEDRRGGIAVTGFAQAFVAQQTPADVRQAAHLRAAQMREQRGEYTLAATHYIQAREHTLAVRLWVPHFYAERNRGMAPRALSAFLAIPADQLDTDEDRRALKLVLGEMQYAAGDAEGVLASMKSISWSPDDPLTPIAQSLIGSAYEQLDRFQEAAEAYQEGLRVLERPAEAQRVHLHRQQGHLILHRTGASKEDRHKARMEALHARFESSLFMGDVEEADGHFDLARQHYLDALTTASEIPNSVRQQHDCHANLGRLAMREGDSSASIDHLNLSITLAQQMSWVSLVASDKITLSGAHIIARQYDQALEVALDGLQQCQTLIHKPMEIIAGLSTNAGEACYHLQRYDEAIAHAAATLSIEEQSYVPYALTVVGMAQNKQGHHAQAAQSLTQAVQVADEMGDQFAQAYALRALGEVNVVLGRRTEAAALFERAIEIFRWLNNEVEATDTAILLAAL